MANSRVLYLTLLGVINAIQRGNDFENSLFFLRGFGVHDIVKTNWTLTVGHFGQFGARTLLRILHDANDEGRIGFHEDCEEHTYVELREFLLNENFEEIDAPPKKYERRVAAELIETAGIELEVVYD